MKHMYRIGWHSRVYFESLDAARMDAYDYLSRSVWPDYSVAIYRDHVPSPFGTVEWHKFGHRRQYEWHRLRADGARLSIHLLNKDGTLGKRIR